MEKAAFIGFLMGVALAWWRKPKPVVAVGEGDEWRDLTSEYYLQAL